ncbi:MAG: diacylglycerol kinase [Candidatus Omnitrophota bacterium]
MTRTLKDSFLNSLIGIKEIFKTQRNARIILAVAAVVVLTGFAFRVSVAEMGLLVLAIGLVFVSEVFNTMTEEVLNIISPQYNHKARIVKDVAAGAVLVACLVSVVIGFLVFLPRIF